MNAVTPADDGEARHAAEVAAKITERGRTPEQRAELRRLFDYGGPMSAENDQMAGAWISLAPYGLGKYEAHSPGGYGLDESQWPIRHRTKGTRLRVTLGTHGYPQVKPYNDQGKQETRTVHSLIMLANCGWPGHGQETRHLNSDPLDYRWAPGGEEETKKAGGNLVYGSKPQNAADQRAAGTAVQPRSHRCVNHGTCGGMVAKPGSRCLPCAQEVGRAAAAMLGAGMSLETVTGRLGYSSADWVHKLARDHGGYQGTVGQARAQGRTLRQRTIATLRYRLKM